MTINAPFGSNLYSILREYKASFIWDPFHPTLGLGAGLQGSSGVECTVQDIDSVTGNEPYCVWDSANDRFEVIYPDTTPDKILGDVGEFSDGKYTSYWWAQWDATNLGFSVTAPTSAGALGQVTGTSPDIYYHTSMPDVTYVDTDGEAQDSVIERSQSKSATYDRTFQIFVKSLDGEDPTGKVKVGFNGSAGTRTVTDTVWCRQLPGSRNWWAIISHCPSNIVTTNYITMSFAQNTGRWYLAAPNWYNTYSTFENIVRSPIPRIDSNYYSRGQHTVYNTNLDFAIPKSGWLAMSMILPDRGITQGHQHYDGTSEYNFAGVYSWSSIPITLRAYMSSSYNRITFVLDYNDYAGTTDTLFVLNIGDDWNEFEAVGIVLTWGISNGYTWAYLYRNGEKQGGSFKHLLWIDDDLSPSSIYIGSDGSPGSAADLWIPRFAIGRSPLHRGQARILSAKMRQYTRTGNAGLMSQIT